MIRRGGHQAHGEARPGEFLSQGDGRRQRFPRGFRERSIGFSVSEKKNGFHGRS
jgi:hypothetical protein